MSLIKLMLGAAAFMMASSAQAQSTVWKCTGPDGRPQYTNVQRDTQGRNCTVVNREVSVVPAPKASTRSESASSSFPKVDAETQHGRDDTRRKILEGELTSEENQLAEARAKLAEQDAVRLGDERNYQKKLDRLQPYREAVEQHEKNIQALQKEIGNLK
ncbi:MAG TPA: DUF4124 domain-containing protein [Burkholderiales bacterium]|jgi:hypothetical protein